jgi:hypothetical protein
LRLQLTGLVLLTALTARAQDRAGARVDVYDDGEVRAIVPATRVSVKREEWSLAGGYAADVVSGATAGLGADVVSTATTFDDVRHSADLSGRVVKGTRSYGLGWAGSVESDYATQAPSVSAAVELLDRTATLDAKVGGSFERAWKSSGGPFSERTTGVTLDVGWTQILDKRTVLALAGTAGWLDCGPVLGCTASPYRDVPAWDDGDVVLALPERHPDTRGRLALGARLSRSLGPVAAHAGYRFYDDTWGVTGHTVTLAGAGTAFGERLLLRGEARGSWQTAALFFEPAYATDTKSPSLPEWRTADLELSGLRDLAVTGRVEWSSWNVGPLLRVGVSARLTRAWFRYPEVSERPERDAWIVGGGLDVER